MKATSTQSGAAVLKTYPDKVGTGREPVTNKKAFGTLIKIEQCPRNVSHVYALGVRLQNYIVDRYLELAATQQCMGASCEALAGQRLESKKQIESMANHHLNQLLTYFYDNGGPVIEDPVSEQEARLILPFFSRIMTNFEKHLHSILIKAVAQKISSDQLQASINGMLVSTYSAISDLYQNQDMQSAFMDLSELSR